MHEPYRSKFYYGYTIKQIKLRSVDELLCFTFFFIFYTFLFTCGYYPPSAF